MMTKKYCAYCGEKLNRYGECPNGCNEAAERHEQMIEDYMNDPMVQYGWAQQDLIDQYRMER